MFVTSTAFCLNYLITAAASIISRSSVQCADGWITGIYKINQTDLTGRWPNKRKTNSNENYTKGRQSPMKMIFKKR